MDVDGASNLIYDVGAHKGEDSDFYIKLGYRVVAVEANPTLAENLRTRFSNEIRDGIYTLVEKAIGELDGKIPFYINKKVSVWGTADRAWADRNLRLGEESEEVTVQCVRFPELIKSYGCPQYLKIDVEGADMLCVNGLFEVDCRPKYISIESTKTSWTALLNEFRTLETLGYTKFKVVNQKAHKNGTFSCRNGAAISYTFEEDATGPFGEWLEGVWLTKKEAIRRYIVIFFLYKTIGDNTLLPKILRRIPLVQRHVNYET